MLILVHLVAAILVATALSAGVLIARRFVPCPMARYRLGIVTLGLLLVLPVVQIGLAAMMTGPDPETRFMSAAQVFGAPAPQRAEVVTGAAPQPVSAPAAHTTDATARIDPLAVVLWVYGAAAGLVIGWTAWRALLTRRTLSRATKIDDERVLEIWRGALRDVGIRRPVRLLSSDGLSTPASWALGRWTVLLPATLHIDDARQLRCVLVHELTHLARRDHWMLIARQIIVGIYWLSPPAWLLSRAVSVDCELSCDRHVVRRTGSARAYAHALLTAATGGTDRLSLATSMSGGAQKDLTWRITMLSTTLPRYSARKQALACGAIVLMGVAGAAASAGAFPLGAHPPEVIIMHAPTVQEGGRIVLGGQTVRGLSRTDESTAEQHMRERREATAGLPTAIMQETVLSVAGVQMRDGRIIAETVDMNLPENSQLGARIAGHEVTMAPGTEGATITVTGGAIEILDTNGETRIRASVTGSDSIRAVCRVIANEYNFALNAVDAHGNAAPITVQLQLGEHEDPADDQQGWVLLPEDGRYRVKMRRHTHSIHMHGIGGVLQFQGAGTGDGPSGGAGHAHSGLHGNHPGAGGPSAGGGHSGAHSGGGAGGPHAGHGHAGPHTGGDSTSSGGGQGGPHTGHGAGGGDGAHQHGQGNTQSGTLQPRGGAHQHRHDGTQGGSLLPGIHFNHQGSTTIKPDGRLPGLLPPSGGQHRHDDTQGGDLLPGVLHDHGLFQGKTSLAPGAQLPGSTQPVPLLSDLPLIGDLFRPIDQ